MELAATAAALLTTVLTGLARADGGSLRYWERQGAYEIAVFTEPTPLSAGVVDISVLALDRSSGQPVPDATIQVELAPAGRRDRTIRQAATAAAATNKLYRSALVDLPTAGPWLVHVAIDSPRGNASVNFPIEVGSPSPPWLLNGSWLGWPIGVIFLYVIHQWLVHRKTHARAGSLEVKSR